MGSARRDCGQDRLPPDLYRHKVASLAAALQDPTSRDQALGLLRGLVEAMMLHPSDTGFAIGLVGKIAGMAALAANDNAAPEGAAIRKALWFGNNDCRGRVRARTLWL